MIQSNAQARHALAFTQLVCLWLPTINQQKASDAVHCAGETIVVVTHGGFLSALYRIIMQRTAPSAKNCSVSEVITDGTTLALETYNVQVITADAGTFGGAG